MHLLETYALLSGAKIGQCYIDTEPVPLPAKNYITFHPECQKATARQYSRWNDVIGLLKNHKIFNEQYIIIQIGSITDNKYDVDEHYLGSLNFQQLAFLIKHSSLHLGYDSFPMHMASHFDKKMVALFAYYAKSSGPYFSSVNNIRLLEPDYTKYKPSFSFIDEYNLINTIEPIVVYQNILDLLSINNDI